MKKVKINGELFFAEENEKLSDILIKNNKFVAHDCGGKGICKKCRIFVNGKEKLSCQYRINADIEVIIPQIDDIVSATGIEETKKSTENTCLCLDIGTTTLALALISLDEKTIIKSITKNNPQRIFGADIMSRIDFCKNNGVEKIRNILIDTINEMIYSFGTHNAETLFVAGNTTMLHIFWGIDPSPLGTAPYTPVFLESKKETEPIINGIKKIISLPCISSFIGADITAGLNLLPVPEKEKYSLLVDLGTNAEIVLFSEDKYLCTSAAAGPCFEGANISCGMSATEGAIRSYSEGKIQVIGNKKAKGICGTGLIDVISQLISSGEIDRTGFMECEEFQITEDVFITQEDVRQYQLAKAAVFSGIQALIKHQDITFDEIEKIYVSGGFSGGINIENAVKTGLLPWELKDKFVSLNNSSLQGLVKFILENNDLTQITNKAEYIDLSTDKYFNDLFIENMMF